MFAPCLLTLATACLSQTDGERGAFDALLREYVHGSRVDYAGLKTKQEQLGKYVDSLKSVDARKMSRNERMALFINAYNACTLLLIVEHYKPGLKSINDIPEKRRWKHKRWHVSGRVYSLDEIENSVLRPEFKDARVHAAINCASIGCPDLRAKAFTLDGLERQLDEQFKRFVNSPRHVRVANGKLHISAIFTWFASDFLRDGNSPLSYVTRYAEPSLRKRLKAIGPAPKILPLPYDWSLNDTRTGNTR